MAPAIASGETQEVLVKRIRSYQRADKANKMCAECADMGPTYVCLNYQIFVCQLCSGLHRELGHRVKSLSLSQWSSKEVIALETGGGNERAASKWLAQKGAREEVAKSLVPTDVSSIRNVIKQKYVEKKWAKSEDEASTEDGGSQDGANSEGHFTEAPVPGRTEVPEHKTSRPASSGAPSSACFVVSIPAGMVPGMQFRADSPFGTLMVTVPPGVVPGQMVKLCVELPPAAAPAPAPDVDRLGSPAAVPAPSLGVDLLGSTGAASAAAPVLAPSAPAAAPAPAPVVAPGAEWIADFQSAEPKPALADLLDFDVSFPEKQASVEVQPGGLDLTSVFGAAPSSQSTEPVPPTACTAEVAEKPLNPNIEQPVADRLRDAVLGGNNDIVKKLFQECAKPMERPSSLACRPVDSRFALLSNVFMESQHEQMSRQMPHAAMQNVSVCESWMAMGTGFATHSLMVDLGSAQAQNASAQCVSLEASAEPLQGSQASSNFSSDELMQCSPDELLKMQSLIAHALQAQQGVASTAEPASQTGPTADAANEQMGACPVPPKKDFDDLLSLFNNNSVVYGH